MCPLSCKTKFWIFEPWEDYHDACPYIRRSPVPYLTQISSTPNCKVIPWRMFSWSLAYSDTDRPSCLSGKSSTFGFIYYPNIVNPQGLFISRKSRTNHYWQIDIIFGISFSWQNACNVSAKMEHTGISHGATVGLSWDYLSQFPWIVTEANTCYTVTHAASAMLPIQLIACHVDSCYFGTQPWTQP